MIEFVSKILIDVVIVNTVNITVDLIILPFKLIS